MRSIGVDILAEPSVASAAVCVTGPFHRRAVDARWRCRPCPPPARRRRTARPAGTRVLERWSRWIGVGVIGSSVRAGVGAAQHDVAGEIRLRVRLPDQVDRALARRSPSDPSAPPAETCRSSVSQRRRRRVAFDVQVVDRRDGTHRVAPLLAPRRCALSANGGSAIGAAVSVHRRRRRSVAS